MVADEKNMGLITASIIHLCRNHEERWIWCKGIWWGKKLFLVAWPSEQNTGGGEEHEDKIQCKLVLLISGRVDLRIRN